MSILEFEEISNSVKTAMNNNYKSIQETKKMLEEIDNQNVSLILYTSGNKVDEIPKILEADKKIRNSFSVLKSNISEPMEKERIEELVANYDSYYTLLQYSINTAPLNFDQKNTSYLTKVYPAYKKTRNNIKEVNTLNSDKFYQQAIKSKDNAKRAIMPSIVSMIAIIIFALILNLFINIYFISPVKRLIDSVSHFYPEQYEIKAKIKSNDELKKLETSINDMIRRLARYRNSNSSN